ncbi:MAG TPA: RNA polymerase factor sigma-54, partial [Oceanospirillaceae bacterium]|nr:RNA polymerase factor sigma-54 [Oceanospirillaceae bacterium]
MKASLQLKMNQQLAMTPQLQQAIRLLQLSTLDLQQEIQQALDSNPLLEVEEDQDQEPSQGDDNLQSQDPGLPSDDQDTNAANKDQSNDHLEDENYADSDWNEDIPVELATDSAWDDVFQNTAGSGAIVGGDDFDFDSINGDTPDLQAHLEWQLNLTPMSDIDRFVATSVIDAIDERGYLSQSHAELLEGINSNFSQIGLEESLEMDELLAVIHRIQQFDPLGVAAQDLRECLLIQLRQLPTETPWREGAITIVGKYLDILASHDYNLLRRRSGYKEAQLQDIIALITSLQPEPGAKVAINQAEYIVPDVMVRKVNGAWRVELNPDSAPKIRINQQYASLGKSANTSDNQFIKNHLQDAKWFLKSLESR